jgi:hypothetical protein
MDPFDPVVQQGTQLLIPIRRGPDNGVCLLGWGRLATSTPNGIQKETNLLGKDCYMWPIEGGHLRTAHPGRG